MRTVYREHSLDHLLVFAVSRFIPVYTGNTKYKVTSTEKETVYPCVYREHAVKFFLYSAILGLSLCIQGTRRFQDWVSAKSRFIPVYTGNTQLILFRKHTPTVYPCVYREHAKK